MLALWFIGSSSAQAAAIVQCAGTVTVGDTAIAVSGHGADEAAARADARRMGRHAGVRLFAERLWTPLLTEDDAGLQRTLDAATIDPSFGVPGATWADGACAPFAVPDAPGFSAPGFSAPGFSATVADQTASRAAPALAVTAARRAACEQAWAVPVTRGFIGMVMAPVERRPEILSQAFAGGRAGLSACHAASPVVAAAGARSDPAPGGLVECRALASDLRPRAVGVGFGRTVDAAFEDAAWETGTNRVLDGLAASTEALAHAAPDARSALIARGLQEAVFMMPSDLGARSLTTCRVVPDAPVRWVPVDLEEAADCADDEEWLTMKAPGPGEAGRTALCTGHAREGLAMVDDAIGHASPEMRGTLQAAGWSIVMGCDAACRTGAVVEGEGEAIAVPGVPSRATKEETLALLRRAQAERDLGLLVAAAPAVADRRALSSYVDNPERFWERLADALPDVAAGALPDGMAWGKVGDAVVLVPAR